LYPCTNFTIHTFLTGPIYWIETLATCRRHFHRWPYKIARITIRITAFTITASHIRVPVANLARTFSVTALAVIRVALKYSITPATLLYRRIIAIAITAFFTCIAVNLTRTSTAACFAVVRIALRYYITSAALLCIGIVASIDTTAFLISNARVTTFAITAAVLSVRIIDSTFTAGTRAAIIAYSITTPIFTLIHTKAVFRTFRAISAAIGILAAIAVTNT